MGTIESNGSQLVTHSSKAYWLIASFIFENFLVLILWMFLIRYLAEICFLCVFDRRRRKRKDPLSMKLKTDEERKSTDFPPSKETDGLIANGRVYVKLIRLIEMLLCTCNILLTLDQVL